MVLWIGLDDTDSLQGMCTTYLATELVSELTKDYDLIGYPRLVRLNPNIPWKTRGNGAICLRFSKGVGRGTVIGEIANQWIRSFARARGRDDPASVRDRVARLVEKRSEFRDPSTNPGFCILPEPPRAALYWKAVRRVVAKEEAIREIRTSRPDIRSALLPRRDPVGDAESRRGRLRERNGSALSVDVQQLRLRL